MRSDSPDLFKVISSKWWNDSSIVDLTTLIKNLTITTTLHYTNLLKVRLIIAEYFERAETKSQHYYGYRDVILTLRTRINNGNEEFEYSDILTKGEISEIVFALNMDISLPDELKINFYNYLNFEFLKLYQDQKIHEALIIDTNPQKTLDILIKHFDGYLHKSSLDFNSYKLYRFCIINTDQHIAPLAIEMMKSIADNQPLKFLTIMLGFFGSNKENYVIQKGIKNIIPDPNSFDKLVLEAKNESSFDKNKIIQIISNLCKENQYSETELGKCDIKSEEYKYLNGLKLINPYFNFDYVNRMLTEDDVFLS